MSDATNTTNALRELLINGVEIEDVLKQLIDVMFAPPANISWRLKDGRWFDLANIEGEGCSVQENNRKYLIHLLEQIKYE